MMFITDGRLSESSRNLYNKKIAQYVSFMPDGGRSVGYIVDNPGIAYKVLLEEKSITQSITNRHMFISAIVAYIKHTSDGQRRASHVKRKWEELQKTNWEERRLLDLGSQMTEKELAIIKAVKWRNIVEKRDTLPAGSNERLLLALYTWLPPVRADYFMVRINPPAYIVNDKTKSYIQLGLDGESSLLVIRDFKTRSTYKEIRHKLPQELFEEIVISLAFASRDYLFVMPTDSKRPYDRGGFSKWANKVLHELFGVPMTLTSLRHIFISTLDFTRLRALDLDRIARAMGHGLAMQKEYQWMDYLKDE
jgi:hypothetical protein